ncbi:MAG TPA: DJ-1/PfpI family protein [Telluria sp.]|nr:DJ-1/PfpI family protein [Telluria sp.]
MRLPALLSSLLILCAAGHAAAGALTPWQPRAGHTRPLVAVIGVDGDTELSDYVVPYGILRSAGAADVLALSTGDGPLRLRPALAIRPDAAMAGFDGAHPEGADYVIVPALGHAAPPALLEWLNGQAAKGATIVSICDGALVVAQAGLLRGHRATAHWASSDERARRWPDTQWQANVRYLQDGKLISSAGISAAIPLSLALAEAMGGPAAAAAAASRYGLADWSSRHDSARYGVTFRMGAAYVFNRWLAPRREFEIEAAAGVDEVALALLADAWSSTLRSHAYVLGAADIRSRNGLTIIPDRPAGAGGAALDTAPDAGPETVLRTQLAAIGDRFGRGTAELVAAHFEFPAD